jgi:hypothetical protein
MQYKPEPADTSDVKLPEDILRLAEDLAKNTHENWAAARMREGWSYGKHRSDASKQTPCLVRYEDLPEEEKQYDRVTAMETLKMITLLGYEIKKSS